jgi:hypothetical protein
MPIESQVTFKVGCPEKIVDNPAELMKSVLLFIQGRVAILPWASLHELHETTLNSVFQSGRQRCS